MPKLYTTLSGWWQLFSPTSDYADEAEFLKKLFMDAGVKTVLELGAGGGNIAWYLKKDFELTLTDLSSEMLKMSKKQNPECEHFEGDMRTLNLNKSFDAVFIHDAIMYILNEKDLLTTFKNAAKHLKTGSLIVIAPDCTRETFKETTDYEGHDDNERSVRYMQWTTDPNPNDTEFNYDFIIALKERDKLRTVVDRQVCGLFPRQTWLDLLDKTGFKAKAITDSSTAGEANERIEIFVGIKS